MHVTHLTTEGVNGVEETGDRVAIGHAEGDASGWSALIQTGGVAAYSSERWRSAPGALKLTGDGTDNRVYGRAGFPGIGDGESVHVFFRHLHAVRRIQAE